MLQLEFPALLALLLLTLPQLLLWGALLWVHRRELVRRGAFLLPLLLQQWLEDATLLDVWLVPARANVTRGPTYGYAAGGVNPPTNEEPKPHWSFLASLWLLLLALLLLTLALLLGFGRFRSL